MAAMLAIGYVRVSTDRQADQGASLEAQSARIQAMATVQDVELAEIIVDGGESAKSMNRPGLKRLLAMVEAGTVRTVIVAKLDRLTRSVRDLCELLELFERKRVALVSVAESLDTGSAAGRLVITIMGAVSQWEREAIGERTRDVLRISVAAASGLATSTTVSASRPMANTSSPSLGSRRCCRPYGGFGPGAAA
jgi:DNA invertase Pin-like site-specific DNA recombinase